MKTFGENETLESLRSVLILLIPIGLISREKFLKYSQHVSAFKKFNLNEFVEMTGM